MLQESLTLRNGLGSLLLLCIGVELVRARRERSLIISLLRKTSTFTPVDHGSMDMKDNLSSCSTTTEDPSSSCSTCSNSLIATRCKCQLKVGLRLSSLGRSILRRILILKTGIGMRTKSMQMLCFGAFHLPITGNKQFLYSHKVVCRPSYQPLRGSLGRGATRLNGWIKRRFSSLRASLLSKKQFYE